MTAYSTRAARLILNSIKAKSPLHRFSVASRSKSLTSPQHVGNFPRTGKLGACLIDFGFGHKYTKNTQTQTYKKLYYEELLKSIVM